MQTHAALATHAQLAAVCGADRRWRMPNKLQPAPCCCWVKTADKTGRTSIGTCLGHSKARSDAKLRTRKATEGYVWLGESSSRKQRWHGVKRVAEHAEILLPREIADGTGAQQELAAALVRRQLPTRLSGVDKCCQDCRKHAWERLSEPSFLFSELLSRG